jgi:hypothetical protein
MASFTYIIKTREFTAEEMTAMENFVTAQVTAGTTDGILYDWPYGGTSPRQVRMWSTEASAVAYAEFIDAFTPPGNAAKVY